MLARAGWEDWLARLLADAHAGAIHWVQRHRGNEAGVCRQLRRASRQACEEAGRRGAEVELARQGSPGFRLGWWYSACPRPVTGRAACNLPGIGSEIAGVQVLQPNSIPDQWVAPCPPTLVNNCG